MNSELEDELLGIVKDVHELIGDITSALKNGQPDRLGLQDRVIELKHELGSWRKDFLANKFVQADDEPVNHADTLVKCLDDAAQFL